ncbi:MAG TPA: hypothetical protein VJL29_08260 [Thermoguttaceae bacterium]|nr:hypothetical protein [Thermoguttaceae bacterium]
MALFVQCGHCGLALQVADEFAGRQMKCRCGQVVQVGGRGSSVMDFLSDELRDRDNPLLAETPTQWAKATGATPEIAEQLEKRMGKKLSGNAGFMMAITGAIIALMLIVGLIAALLARKATTSEGAQTPRVESLGQVVSSAPIVPLLRVHPNIPWAFPPVSSLRA